MYFFVEIASYTRASLGNFQELIGKTTWDDRTMEFEPSTVWTILQLFKEDDWAGGRWQILLQCELIANVKLHF